MSQRKKRNTMSLLNSWKTGKTKDRTTVATKKAESHTVATPSQEVKPVPKARVRARAPKPSKPRGRIYLNVVIDEATERRIQRSIERHQAEHGKSFGKSAWGRMAFLAQLEREGN